MQKTATLLLKRCPSDERAREIADRLAFYIGGGYTPVSTVVTDYPPSTMNVAEQDQLGAMRRDLLKEGLEPVFLTVTLATK